MGLNLPLLTAVLLLEFSHGLDMEQTLCRFVAKSIPFAGMRLIDTTEQQAGVCATPASLESWKKKFSAKPSTVA
jgi:hypothetical protein